MGTARFLVWGRLVRASIAGAADRRELLRR